MTISSLQAFLIESAKSDSIETVIVSKRLREHPFKIRALTAGEYREARRRAVNPQAQGAERIDSLDLAKQVVISGCIEPDFRNGEFLEQAGCRIPGDAIDKLLLAGEVTKLSNKIMDASGFSEDIENARDEAKNS